MKKLYLCLLITLSVFSIGKSQSNFGFGFRLNQSVQQKLTSSNDNNLFFATDYTAFIQYKAVGFFGGVTALNNYKTVPMPDAQHIECLTGGIFFKLKDFKKRGSLTLYAYDVHFFSTYYYQTLDLITINPCYRYSFLKNSISLEAGLSIAVARDYFDYFGYINSFVRPAIGANLGLNFNVVALFNKQPNKTPSH